MKETLIGLLKLVLCILIITYAENYFFEFLAWLNININNYSKLVQDIFTLGLYLLVVYAIYIIYRDNINGDFDRFKRKWFPNILMSIVYFAIFTIILWVVNYISDVVANSFDINYIGLSFNDIFTKKFDIDLVFTIIKGVIIIPFITCSAYILGAGEITKSKNMHIILSGIAGAIAAGLAMNGSLLYLIFNTLPYFAMYAALAYIYRKNNNNIWFSITTIILYALFASLIISRIT